MIEKFTGKNFTGRPKHLNCGFAALFLVISASAALLLLTMSAVFLGLGETERWVIFQKQNQAAALTDGCLEEVLIKLQRDFNADLPSNLTLPSAGGDCIINAVSLDPNTKAVTVQGEIDAYVSKIAVEIVWTGAELVLTNWQIAN